MSHDLKTQAAIFRKGSTTFFSSSLFFPKHIRENVYRLYAFLRVADDYVDSRPQRPDMLESFVHEYEQSRGRGFSDDPIMDSFVKLSVMKRFDPEWVKAFFHSMRLDTCKSRYETLKETLKYTYGVAETIGLMMTRILDLPDESSYYARMLGRALQYVNFIRDIPEDLVLGRYYLPTEHFHESIYEEEYARSHEKDFTEFIHLSVRRYQVWLNIARKGFRFLKRRHRIAISTASDMYEWTSMQILKDPFVIYERKIKPSKIRVLMRAFLRGISP